MFAESPCGYFSRLEKKMKVFIDHKSKLQLRLDFVLRSWLEAGSTYLDEYLDILRQVEMIERCITAWTRPAVELQDHLNLIVRTGMYPKDIRPILDDFEHVDLDWCCIVGRAYEITLPPGSFFYGENYLPA